MPEEGGKKSRTEVIFKTIFQEHFPKLEKNMYLKYILKGLTRYLGKTR